MGKLMAQAVKLLTLFAALAPFIAMSFLLGGIDFSDELFFLCRLSFSSRCGHVRLRCFCRVSQDRVLSPH